MGARPMATAATSFPSTANTLPRADGYVRHQPEATPLYPIVRDHLEDFLAVARERSGRPLPRYVEDEFREYLRCGILAHGFGRLQCRECGLDMFVAFSCKGRGLCPSCGVRRMVGTAAHLVDHVFPEVPVRQWVLSTPFELRFLLASRADLLREVVRIANEEILRRQRRDAGEDPRRRGRRDIESGTVAFVQRFGGSLNLHLHLHTIVLDGAFLRDENTGTASFFPGSAPSRDDLAQVVAAIDRRVAKLLHRRGLATTMSDDGNSNECPEPTALEACQQLGLRGGTYGHIDAQGHARMPVPDPDDLRFGRRAPRSGAAESGGWNLQAQVTIPAWDRDGLEKLCRYAARPPLSLERLSVTRDGRIAYRLKYPGRHGETHRLMEPMEFLARLSALVPPPRHPLHVFAGVLAPHSSWRKQVVPAAPAQTCTHGAPAVPTVPHPPVARPDASRPDPIVSPGGMAPAGQPSSPAPAVAPAIAAPGRSRGGAARLQWSELLKRAYDVDVLRCVRCGGTLRLIAAITQPAVAKAILDHVGLPSGVPALRRARAPDVWAEA